MATRVPTTSPSHISLSYDGTVLYRDVTVPNFCFKIFSCCCMETHPRTEQEASHGILSSTAQKGETGKRKRKGRGCTATPTYRSLIEATKQTCVTQLFENSVGAKWPSGVATRRITRSFVYFERVIHLHLYAKC